MSNNQKPLSVTMSDSGAFTTKDGVVSGRGIPVGKAWSVPANKEGTTPLYRIDFTTVLQEVLKNVPQYTNKAGEVIYDLEQVSKSITIWANKEES
jgi:hypothetical protein